MCQSACQSVSDISHPAPSQDPAIFIIQVISKPESGRHLSLYKSQSIRNRHCDCLGNYSRFTNRKVSLGFVRVALQRSLLDTSVVPINKTFAKIKSYFSEGHYGIYLRDPGFSMALDVYLRDPEFSFMSHYASPLL